MKKHRNETKAASGYDKEEASFDQPQSEDESAQIIEERRAFIPGKAMESDGKFVPEKTF